MKDWTEEVSGEESLDALREVAGFRLRRLQGLFQAHWQQWFSEDAEAITPVQGGILLLIERNPGLSQISLARLLRIEAPSLLQTLKPLLEKGLVERERSAQDSRAFRLSLSQSGLALASHVRTQTPEHEDDLLGLLTQRERERLLSLLDKAILSGEIAIGLQRPARRIKGRKAAKLLRGPLR